MTIPGAAAKNIKLRSARRRNLLDRRDECLRRNDTRMIARHLLSKSPRIGRRRGGEFGQFAQMRMSCRLITIK
jgi:hypothetical protein